MSDASLNFDTYGSNTINSGPYSVVAEGVKLRYDTIRYDRRD